MHLHFETAKKTPAMLHKKQYIEVPSALLNRQGAYSRITRSVTTGGTVCIDAPYLYKQEIKQVLHLYGKVAYSGRTLLVVRDASLASGTWRAVQWLDESKAHE